MIQHIACALASLSTGIVFWGTIILWLGGGFEKVPGQLLIWRHYGLKGKYEGFPTGWFVSWVLAIILLTALIIMSQLHTWGLK